MAESTQATLAQMLKLVGDIAIGNDVRDLFDPFGKNLQTWASVNNYIQKNRMFVGEETSRAAKQKLVESYEIKMRHDRGQTDLAFNKELEVDRNLSDQVRDGTEETNAQGQASPVSILQQPATTMPQLFPDRVWRGPNDKTDHGKAARNQYLNPPPPDPWANV